MSVAVNTIKWDKNSKNGMKSQKKRTGAGFVADPVRIGGDCFCSWADTIIQLTPKAG